jgi:hypothetical protein
MTNRTYPRHRRAITSGLVVLLLQLNTLCGSASATSQIERRHDWGIRCRAGAQENLPQPKKKSLFSSKTWFQRSKASIKDVQTRPETRGPDEKFPARASRKAIKQVSPPLVPKAAETGCPGDQDQPVVHSMKMRFAQKAASLLGHSKVPPPPRGTLPQNTRFETVSFGMDRSKQSQPDNTRQQKISHYHGRALVELILAEESRAYRFMGVTEEIDKSLFSYMDPMEIYASVVSEYFEPNDDAVDSDVEDMDYFAEHIMYSSESDELSDYDAIEYSFDDELGAISDRFHAYAHDSEELDDGPASFATDGSVVDLVLDSTYELPTMHPLHPIVVIRPKETQILRRTVTKTRRVPRQTLLSSLEDFDLDDDEFDLLLDDMNSSALIDEEYDVYEYDELDTYAVDQVACVMMLPRTSNVMPMDEESIESPFMLPFTGFGSLGEDDEEDSEETDETILLSSAVPGSWECPDYGSLTSNETTVSVQADKEIEAKKPVLGDGADLSEDVEVVPYVHRADLSAGPRRAPNTLSRPETVPIADETDDDMGGTDWEILQASDLFNHASEFEDDTQESEEELECIAQPRSKEDADITKAEGARKHEQLRSTKSEKTVGYLSKDKGATSNIHPPPPTSDRNDGKRIPPPPRREQNDKSSLDDRNRRRGADRRIPPPPSSHGKEAAAGWKGRTVYHF